LKPNAFPAKIDDIVALIGTGGGSGGGESGSSGALTFASGNFSPSTDGERVTINHGLGVMPDLVIVHLSSIHHAETFEEAAESQALVASWGMKSSFEGSAHSGNIHTIFGISRVNGIDNTSEVDQANGFIYCPDENCFQVGSTKDTGKLYAANSYKWIAVSGIGGGVSEPVIEPLNVTENGTYTAPDGVDGFNPVTVAGSGDSGATLENPIVATGTFKPTGVTHVLQHNLGVIPDCISIRSFNDSQAGAEKNTVLFMEGYRSGLPVGMYQQTVVLALTNGGCTTMGMNQGIETAGHSIGGMRNADASSVTIGGSTNYLDINAEYEWKAVRVLP
jgi:hypothetical protein